MKIINILFCLFLLMLNGCNSNDTNNSQTKSRQKRDLTQKEEVQQEKPKSKEELLREKLSDDQKKHLDWLKEALGNDGEFDKFLGYDESKIKSALNHIKSELDKCTGDNSEQQKSTFKQTVRGFFSGGNIDNFANNAVSNCNNGGS
ncbi:lipoprotein (plasmid) [Borreliella burgdorferi 29805]|uniref:Mlp family lipoprotein n=1 Tax=Borreliella burgdorferi TaxID=139 RepID=UPI00017F4975|nr:Mlp family lipoprotein [Borreliella burgdorferi]ACO38146.1 lipoprotein [Borreliella burgdorferi 29805]MCD2309498.1 Mlp family lipoprotein [Borreliella burgdorferi]MCD2318752.1 Mlp family lipoprotein [Borreliella burgdorferi]MCD2319820.1 Mlp family lipoprotein [Borreliella burgdorferi]MCD2376972.1 Mlp family lipoprotein [Borreliella burgdorferi]